MRMFETRRAWESHELESHRRQWVCQCCSATLSSRSTLAAHITRDHAGLFDELQLELLLNVSSRPQTVIASTECKLCDWERVLRPRNTHVPGCSTVDVTAKQFLRHVAGHQEQLALFALPRQRFDVDGENTAGGGHVRSFASSQAMVRISEGRME